MTNVEFPEEKFSDLQSKREDEDVKTPGMVAFLIRNDLAKGPKSAAAVLIFVVLACASLTAYLLFFKAPDQTQNKPLTVEDVKKFQQEFEMNNTQPQ